MNWQRHFNRAAQSPGPVTVSKQGLGRLPHGFETRGPSLRGLLTLYERSDQRQTIRVLELPAQYIITVSNHSPNNTLKVSSQPAAPSQSNPLADGLQNANLKALGAAAGIVTAGGIGVALGEALSGTQSDSSPDPSSAHRVFISHSWAYEDQFEAIQSKLDDTATFEYFDHSVSSENPLDATLPNHLRKKFRDQMQSVSVVLVLAGMYVTRSESIQAEIEIAADMEKPIIGVIPEGNEQVPNIVETHAAELVEADGTQISTAIERHAQ